ncbi:MAG: dihydroorotase [Thiotrichaceae bacterium]|nr:dihydroorotase [Thiotrichaceae bacterium]
MTHSITLIKPDDFHLHLRNGEALKHVVKHTARQFSRAIVMPNLPTPVTTTIQAKDYRDEIIKGLDGIAFEPLMTLYLTDNTEAHEIEYAKQSGFIHGVKLYPAGATTNSDAGVSDIKKCYGALEAMEKLGLPLLVHGEVTDPEIDIFDREAVFIDTVLTPLIHHFPNLKIVFEHITTTQAVDFVRSAPANIVATLTAHHLLLNRNAIFTGGINPHNYCLPVLKREEHRQQLIKAATSGSEKFFAGTDSAPHAKSAKESSCGCAGMYTAYHAIELYAEAFDSAHSLNKLEGFCSIFGAKFYGLKTNTETIELTKESWEIPEFLPYGEEKLIPFRAGENCHWQLK